MPKKSRRFKTLQSKRKERQLSAMANVPPPVVTQSPKPAAVREVPSPPVSSRAAKTLAITSQYFYTIAELKRIGILAGVMLVILIILALVLP